MNGEHRDGGWGGEGTTNLVKTVNSLLGRDDI